MLLVLVSNRPRLDVCLGVRSEAHSCCCCCAAVWLWPPCPTPLLQVALILYVDDSYLILLGSW